MFIPGCWRVRSNRALYVCRMVADGAVPNTKTFTALIGSFGKMGSVGAALDIITELLGHDQGMAASASTYAALMAACEKAGQGDLALALFEKMKAQVHILLYTLFRLGAHEEHLPRSAACLQTADQLCISVLGVL